MIRYHGGPVTPVDAGRALWTARHAFISFANRSQMPFAMEVAQSVSADCGSFSLWMEYLKAIELGENVSIDDYIVDVPAYAAWVRSWQSHHAFDFAIIPDIIDGSEFDNDQMIAQWICGEGMRCRSVPVWHLHESIERLVRLVRGVLGGVYDRVALGSSGKWATPGTDDWWERMEDVRPILTDDRGRMLVRVHGLRMMSPTIFSHIPFASVDSCNVAMNIGIDKKWTGTYAPLTAKTRALVLAERCENHAVAATWSRRVGIQQNLELVG